MIEKDMYSYKAKEKNTNQWVEGYIYDATPLYCFKEDYKKLDPELYIIKPGFADWGMPRPMEVYEIIPSTVSKFIGYYDSNYNKIYENDFVRFYFKDELWKTFLIWRNKEIRCLTAINIDGIKYNGTDYYNPKYNYGFSFQDFCTMIIDPWRDYSKIVVYGNIIDNHDLINFL